MARALCHLTVPRHPPEGTTGRHTGAQRIMPLTTYSIAAILGAVPWTVEVTGEFETWWDGLTEEERVSIDGMIHVLEAHGPSLGPPYSVPVGGSRYAQQLRQLLVPHHDTQICVLYISDDPSARLVLLTGTTRGTDDDVCPPEDVERADAIYQRYVSGRTSSH